MAILILFMCGVVVWIALNGEEDKPDPNSAPYKGKVGFKYIGPGVHAGKKVQLCATAPSGEVRAKVRFKPKHGEVSRRYGGHSSSEGGFELPPESGCMYYTAPILKGSKVKFDVIELKVEGEKVAEVNLPIYPKKFGPTPPSITS